MGHGALVVITGTFILVPCLVVKSLLLIWRSGTCRFCFDCWVQDCSISSALAMEILQLCTKPSVMDRPSWNGLQWLTRTRGYSQDSGLAPATADKGAVGCHEPVVNFIVMARLQYLQCFSNGAIAVLYEAIDMYSGSNNLIMALWKLWHFHYSCIGDTKVDS